MLYREGDKLLILNILFIFNQMFTQKFYEFFLELEESNTKSWFDQNKTKYEKNVKSPFLNLLADLISQIQEFDPLINTSPKNVMFRINRDVRFSKDKSPYKLNVGASINTTKRSAKDDPGYFINISNKSIQIGGGCYFVSPSGISKIRNHILNNQEEFLKLQSSNEFQSHFGEIRGDKNKRLPEIYTSLSSKIPEIMNKKFYFEHNFPTSELFNEDLSHIIVSYYKIGYPLISFLRTALIES